MSGLYILLDRSDKIIANANNRDEIIAALELKGIIHVDSENIYIYIGESMPVLLGNRII